MRPLRRVAAAAAGLCVLLATALVAARPVVQAQNATYTLITAAGRRNLTVRIAGGMETVALDQFAAIFKVRVTEDELAGGLVIDTAGQRIMAVPGQSFVQVAGRVVSLDGPVRRDRNAWVVPLDFLPKALGPAVGQPIVVRRASRLVLVGNVRAPQIDGRVERTSDGARVVVNIQPATPHRVTRDGSRLLVQFDAVLLDAKPLTGFIPEFASAARVDGTTLVIDLGRSAATYRAEDDSAQTRLTIDLAPPPPVVPPPPKPATVPVTPPSPVGPPSASDVRSQIESVPGTLRTIVIDPGHGGTDEGAHGARGTVEKTVTLDVARRLKAAIESRMGLRVLLTREGDDDVPVDRRTAIANNNKADLLISLHANGSVRPAARGAQIYSQIADPARERAIAEGPRRAVPLLGGGMRTIDVVPWDEAQAPFVGQSSAFAALLVGRLTARNVPLFAQPALQAPMRVLAGANMPAVLVELGFLSNEDDEKALTGNDEPTAIVEGILAALAEVRRGFPTAGPGRGGQ